MNFKFVVVLSNFVFNAYGQGNLNASNLNEALTRLHQDLFSTYDKNIRYYNPFKPATVIFFNYTMQSLNDLNELEGTLTTAGLMRIYWMDPVLNWDPSLYGDINYTYVPQSDIWKPDLILANGNKKKEELGGSNYFVTVLSLYDQGQGYSCVVLWEPYEVFTTLCSIDTTYFPFDRQTCYMKFTIWSYKNKDVFIANESYLHVETTGNSIWEIKDISSEVISVEFRREARFRLDLKRKPAFFVLNILFPVMILGCVSTFVFLIPGDAGEKIGFSVTVFLSFAVFLTIVSAQLPKNSDNIPILNIYKLLQVFAGVSSLFISTIQVRLYHRNSSDIGAIYKRVVTLSRAMCCRGKTCRENAVSRQISGTSDRSEPKRRESYVLDTCSYTWVDVSHAMDTIGFIFFSLLNAIATSIVLIILVHH